MAFQAQVFNVMIASPGDVQAERALVRQVVHEWNAVHSSVRSVVLLPVGYDTHAAPLLGESPQATINWQVLKDSDLLIAVFWTRLGTPTDKFPSGTVEEIEKHLAADKPAMLYFSGARLVQGSFDEKQYKALLKFKKDMEKRGLYATYEDLADFRAKVSQHLASVLNTHPFFRASGKPAEEAPSAAPTPTLNVPALSREATQLLYEATKDRTGTVICLRSNMGLHIQTNDKGFVEGMNPRSEATWLAALKELIANRLIEDRGLKGEVFRVTRRGYELAELIPA